MPIHIQPDQRTNITEDCGADVVFRETGNPEQVYQAQLERYQTEQKKLERASGRLSSARLVLFLMTLAFAWFSFVDARLSPVWPGMCLVAFLIAVALHSRTTKQQQLAQRAGQFYAWRLDHLAGRWPGRGNAGRRYGDANHLYSSDLDIFGEGSLFEFLCGARTRMGEDRLAAWLRGGADLKTIERRQQAVEELCGQIEFREQMSLLDAVSDNELDEAAVRQRIGQARPIPRWQPVLAGLLGASGALSIVAWACGYGVLPLLIVAGLEIPLYALSYGKIKSIAARAEQTGSTLATLARVLHLIEQNTFKTPLLQELHKNLQTEGHSPSWQISRLHRLIHLLDQSLRNQMLMPLAFLFGLPILLSHRLDQWRRRIGPHMALWLDAVGQIEALGSLAQYRFENPRNPFPDLVPESGAPCIEAIELGHPLIPAWQRVPNDVRIDAEQRLIMVSGSNMSGKSTLLRAIGVNLVLAFCGAPVQAKILRTSCFTIGSAMRANDSLQQGVSLFYTVISRIKRIVDLAGQSPPLLFLLDEILQGTHSHDRLIGARAIIYQLLERNAVGLVTTHDLVLTKIVDSLGARAVNMHFEDHILDGQIHFDYKIRPGVVQKSNGLALMRMIGLDINPASASDCRLLSSKRL